MAQQERKQEDVDMAPQDHKQQQMPEEKRNGDGGNDRKEGEEIVRPVTWFVDEYVFYGTDVEDESKISDKALQLYNGGTDLSLAQLGVPEEYIDRFEVKQIAAYDLGDVNTPVSMDVSVERRDKFMGLELQAAAYNCDYWLDIVDRVMVHQVFHASTDGTFMREFNNVKVSTSNVCFYFVPFQMFRIVFFKLRFCSVEYANSHG